MVQTQDKHEPHTEPHTTIQCKFKDIHLCSWSSIYSSAFQCAQVYCVKCVCSSVFTYILFKCVRSSMFRCVQALLSTIPTVVNLSLLQKTVPYTSREIRSINRQMMTKKLTDVRSLEGSLQNRCKLPFCTSET